MSGRGRDDEDITSALGIIAPVIKRHSRAHPNMVAEGKKMDR